MLELQQLALSRHDEHFSYSFTAHESQLVLITGESGAGKSTLLDLIAGFVPAQAGSVKLFDHEFTQQAVKDRPVTTLFQSFNLFMHLSVLQNLQLAFDSKQLKKEESQQAIRSIAEFMGIDAFLSRLPTQLSGGQQQRVALARALLAQRKIVLLDEPFSALDANARKELLLLVKQITQDRGLITLLVSHHGDEVLALADQHLHLHNGLLEKLK